MRDHTCSKHDPQSEGAAFLVQCAACRRDNPDDAAFCNGCGQPMEKSAAARATDRRPITVVFCDMADSVALASGTDPEDWRSVVVRYHAICRKIINDHDGFVVQYLGDGVLAYFGFPVSGERDAVNAVRAGLEIVDQVKELAIDVAAEFALDLQVRVGVHTGLVVLGDVGDGTRAEVQAVGDTLNIAARFEGAARPNSVAISPDTLALVEGLFEVESLGKQQLKGMPLPVEVWMVVGSAGVAHRLDAAAPASLSPFLGRQAELSAIVDAWQAAQQGEGQLIAIVGEAGVGKSRLAREARTQVQSCGGLWLQARCLPDSGQTPFKPWIDLLRHTFDIEAASDPDQAMAAIARDGAALGLAPATIERLGELLGLIKATGLTSLGATRRRETLAALIAWLAALAGESGAAVAIEDLHWADPSTLELLIAVQAAAIPVTVLVTSRPISRTHDAPSTLTERLFELTTVQLDLEALNADVTRQLAVSLVGDVVTDEVLNAIVERSSGLPLFLEELVRNLRPLADPDTVPPTLRVSLTTRLDQLGPAKELAQIASVIGRTAPIELLFRVAGGDGPDRVEAVQAIVDAGLAERVETPDGEGIEFIHALIADVAYDSLLKARRRELHGSIASHLHGTSLDREQPERVARHFELARDDRAALAAWKRAVRHALRTYSLEESHAHLQSALACVQRLGSKIDARTELGVRIDELNYLSMRFGYTGAQLRPVLDRALEIIDGESIDDLMRFDVLLKIVTHASACSSVDEANMWADQVLTVSADLDMPLIDFMGASPVATSRLLAGRYGEARDLAEAGMDNEPTDPDDPIRRLPGVQIASIMTLSILGHARVALGETEKASGEISAAVARARAANPADPHSLAWTLYFRAMLHLMEDERDGCRADAAEARSIGDLYGFAELSAAGCLFEACIDIRDNRDPAAACAVFEEQRQSVPEFSAWVYLRQMYFVGLARSGRAHEAVDLALAERDLMASRGEGICAEDLDALIGELRWRIDGRLSSAEPDIARAWTTSIARSAPGQQLRVAIAYAQMVLATPDATNAQRALAEERLNGAVSAVPGTSSSRIHEAAAMLVDLSRQRVEPDQLPHNQEAQDA